MSLGDQVQNIPAPNTSGFPTIVGPTSPPNPYQGMTWLNNGTNQLSVYNNGAWVLVSTGGGSSLPTPNAEGDVLIADATLNWVPTAHIDNGRY